MRRSGSRSGHPARPLLAVVVTGVLAATAAVVLPAGAAGAAPRAAQAPLAAVDRVDRVASQAARFERELGAGTTGAYVEETGGLSVTVLTAAAEARVRSLGATPRKVRHSRAELDAAMAALPAAPAGLSWGIDVPRNALVVSVPRGREAASGGFLRQARSTGVPVIVERVDSAPRPMAYYGGELLRRTDGFSCSAGFTARRNRDGALFILTAGHCLRRGGTWYGDGRKISSAGAYSYPSNDFGILFVANPAALDPRGAVIYDGRAWDISGSISPPVGQGACKTGFLTRTTCGKILRYNVSVNYGDGVVGGLIETTLCAGGGDSGGPLFSGHRAVGLVSGGSTGPCRPGFRTFFQPVGEPLSAFGLTLT